MHLYVCIHMLSVLVYGNNHACWKGECDPHPLIKVHVPMSLRALEFFEKNTISCMVQSDLNALKEMTGQVTSIHQTYMYSVTTSQ